VWLESEEERKGTCLSITPAAYLSTGACIGVGLDPQSGKVGKGKGRGGMGKPGSARHGARWRKEDPGEVFCFIVHIIFGHRCRGKYRCGAPYRFY